MLDRFLKINDHLYRGGAPDYNDLKKLKNEFGIKKIVSLDDEIGDEIHDNCRKLKLAHFIIPLTDGNGKNTELFKRKVVDILDSYGPTYVHCKHGKDRTGMVCALYRIKGQGWNKTKALKEAYKMGMGSNLSPEQAYSYYRVVLEGVDNGDENNTEDIVSKQRSNYIQGGPSGPGGNFSNESIPNLGSNYFFIPSDPEVDHLNRPASNNLTIRKNAYLKLFKYSKPSKVLADDEIWLDSPTNALKFAGNIKNGELFSALVSNGARVSVIDNEMTNDLIYRAKKDDPDIALFISLPYRKYYVYNSGSLINVKEVDIEDVNNSIQVGMHDNYTGLAPHSFPGSGGWGSGSGVGGAGIVFFPYTGEF